MASPELLAGLNAHLNREYASYFLYLSISGWFEHRRFRGFAKWAKKQAADEFGHAGRFYDFITLLGESPALGALAAPPAAFNTIKHALESALAHERNLSAALNELLGRAAADADHLAVSFLKDFLVEQINDTQKLEDLLHRLDYLGDTHTAHVMIDKGLAKEP